MLDQRITPEVKGEMLKMLNHRQEYDCLIILQT